METVQIWQIFLAIGVVLAVAEIFIPGFVVLPIGLGFILTAPIAYLSDSLTLQLVALAIVELLVFFLMKKYRRDLGRPQLYSNAVGMVGKECEVTEPVSAKNAGYVKLYGDRWQALTHSTVSFKVGDRAMISRIDGNKVYIEPINYEGDHL